MNVSTTWRPPSKGRVCELFRLENDGDGQQGPALMDEGALYTFADSASFILDPHLAPIATITLNSSAVLYFLRVPLTGTFAAPTQDVFRPPLSRTAAVLPTLGQIINSLQQCPVRRPRSLCSQSWQSPSLLVPAFSTFCPNCGTILPHMCSNSSLPVWSSFVSVPPLPLPTPLLRCLSALLRPT